MDPSHILYKLTPWHMPYKYKITPSHILYIYRKGLLYEIKRCFAMRDFMVYFWVKIYYNSEIQRTIRSRCRATLKIIHPENYTFALPSDFEIIIINY